MSDRRAPHVGGSRMADNIVQFGRALRRAGLPVGPAAMIDAIRAVEAAGIGSREDFYWTLHSAFVKRGEHRAVFHEVFELFWRERGLLEKMLAMLAPVAPAAAREKERPKPAQARAREALSGRNERERREARQEEREVRLVASGREVLQSKDFAQMSAAELAAAKRALAGLRLPDDRLETRRLTASPRGRVDPRRTLRASLRVGGDILVPQMRARAETLPPIVAICDISGSMSPYSRLMLHFLHGLAERRRRVHSFVFGTRLTNVTRQLRARDVDEALAACSAAVVDWSGGTRIAAALRAFNRDWSRRVLGQGATVILITDGLERDEGADLGREMDRLHRSCRRLIWLNPLLRFEGFEARARSVRAMLPHVDQFRPVHSLAAVSDLVAALADREVGSGDPRRYLNVAA